MRKDYNYSKKIIIFVICFVIILIALVLQNRTFRIIFLSVGAAIIIVGTILFIRHVVNVKRSKKKEEERKEEFKNQGQQKSVVDKQMVEIDKQIKEEKRRQKEEEEKNAKEKLIYNFNKYIKDFNEEYEYLENNERINIIFQNFFKANQECIFFFFLDSIIPEGFINNELIFKVKKMNAERDIDGYNKTTAYKYLMNHSGGVAVDAQSLLDWVEESYETAEIQSFMPQDIYGKVVDNIYANVEKLLFSFITTGLIKNNSASKSACLVYFNMVQNRLIKDYVIKNHLKSYNSNMPNNLKELALILLNRDITFSLEKIILYGCALFSPWKAHMWALADELVKLLELKEQIKQEKFIRELETFDSSRDREITKSDLTLMSGFEFEEFIAKFFEKLGYHSRTTKKSGDQGVDVLAEKDGRIIAIQTKCYNQPVGNKAVQEIVAGMKFYHAQKGIVVTNSTFTPSAKELALANRIVLWDGDTLMSKYRMTEDNLFDEE